MERKTINLLIEDFDYIKEYCDRETLNMPKWIVKEIKKIIGEKEMFKKLTFSHETRGPDHIGMICNTKDGKKINIIFQGLWETKLINSGKQLSDDELIRCMAYEAYKNRKNTIITEDNYNEDWKNFEINDDCIIEKNPEGGITI